MIYTLKNVYIYIYIFHVDVIIDMEILKIICENIECATLVDTFGIITGALELKQFLRRTQRNNGRRNLFFQVNITPPFPNFKVEGDA